MANEEIRILNHYPEKTEYQKAQEARIAEEKGWNIESPLDPELEALIPEPFANVRSAFGDLEHLVGPDGKMQFVQKLYGPWTHPVDAGYQPIRKVGGPKGVFDATPRWYVDKKVEMAIQSVTGEIVFCGTYDAANNVIASISAKAPASFVVGQQVPAADDGIKNHFLVNISAGTSPATDPLPAQILQAGDWVICDGTAWNIIPLGGIATVSAEHVMVNPTSGGEFDGETALDGVVNVLEERGLFDHEQVDVLTGYGAVNLHVFGNTWNGVYEKTVFTYEITLEESQKFTSMIPLRFNLPQNWFDGLLMPTITAEDKEFKSFAPIYLLDKTDLSAEPLKVGRIVAFVEDEITKFALDMDPDMTIPAGAYIGRYETQSVIPY